MGVEARHRTLHCACRNDCPGFAPVELVDGANPALLQLVDLVVAQASSTRRLQCCITSVSVDYLICDTISPKQWEFACFGSVGRLVLSVVRLAFFDVGVAW